MENKEKGTAPPCGLQRRPSHPLPYNLQYVPQQPLKTSMYLMLTEQTAERWEPTRKKYREHLMACTSS